MFILDFHKEPPTNKINSPHRKIIFSKLRLSPCFMAKSLFHSYIPLCHGSIPGFSWLNDVKSIFSSFFKPCPHRFLHRSTPRPSSARSGVQVPLLELGTGIRQHQLRFRQKNGIPSQVLGNPKPTMDGSMCVFFERVHKIMGFTVSQF
jgi:hypothetical protein